MHTFDDNILESLNCPLSNSMFFNVLLLKTDFSYTELSKNLSKNLKLKILWKAYFLHTLYLQCRNKLSYMPLMVFFLIIPN